MGRTKEVLTTGEVAKACNVAPRTVSKWFDSGKLKGYRIPGSKDRRIPLSALIHFMREHDMPLDGLRSGRTRLLIVDCDADLLERLAAELIQAARYDVRVARSGFNAGRECQRFDPHVLLVDAHLPDLDPVELARSLRDGGENALLAVIATSDRLTEGQARQMLRSGVDAFLRKPLSARAAVEAVEAAVSPIG